MTINEIIDYATHSPENTNPNVLKSMLDSINSGGQELPEDALIYLPTEVEIDDEDIYTLTKTWQEIAQNNYYIKIDSTYLLLLPDQSHGSYYIDALSLDTHEIETHFYAKTPQDYPSTGDEEGPK